MNSMRRLLFIVCMIYASVCLGDVVDNIDAVETGPVALTETEETERVVCAALQRLLQEADWFNDDDDHHQALPTKKRMLRKKGLTKGMVREDDLINRSINVSNQDQDGERLLYEFLKARCLKNKKFGNRDVKQKSCFHGPVEINDGSLVIKATCQPPQPDDCSCDTASAVNTITCAQEHTLVSCFDPVRNVLVLEFDEAGLLAGGAQVQLSFVGSVIDEDTGEVAPVCFTADACIHPCMSADDFFRREGN